MDMIIGANWLVVLKGGLICFSYTYSEQFCLLRSFEEVMVGFGGDFAYGYDTSHNLRQNSSKRFTPYFSYINVQPRINCYLQILTLNIVIYNN